MFGNPTEGTDHEISPKWVYDQSSYEEATGIWAIEEYKSESLVLFSVDSDEVYLKHKWLKLKMTLRYIAASNVNGIINKVSDWIKCAFLCGTLSKYQMTSLPK